MTSQEIKDTALLHTHGKKRWDQRNRTLRDKYLFIESLGSEKARHMPTGVIYHRTGNTKTNWGWSSFLCKVKLPLSQINRGANPLKLCRYESEMRHSTHDFIGRKIIKPMVICLDLWKSVFCIENTLDRLILNNFPGY